MLKVLELNPWHADALCFVLDISEPDETERMDCLEGIVSVATKLIGKKTFFDLATHFWGFAETRPYMRACEQLGFAYLQAGEFELAAQVFDNMLVMNPNDNQGVRYQLLLLRLVMGEIRAARSLLKAYRDDSSVVWAWGRLLERWLNGDAPATHKALEAARACNPHAEALITGESDEFPQAPEMYEVGSEGEALNYATGLKAAWLTHQGAIEWMRAQALPNKTKPRKPLRIVKESAP